jgi:chitinase
MVINKQVQVYLPSYASVTEYQNIRYDLVTAVNYAFMFIRGDGSLFPEDGYNPDALISYAHTNNVKVILTIACISSTDADTLLASSTARTTAINNIFNEVVARGFDGVDNDIESSTISTANKSNMAAFQTELANKFWGSNPNYRLSIAVSGYYPNSTNFDLFTLQNYCNYVMIMGYDWYGSWNTFAGPNSPLLLDDGTGIMWSIKYYEGVMDKSKLLLGVPYYGHEFATVSDARLATRSTGGSVIDIVYDEFIDLVPAYTRYYDSVWQTPWYTRQSGSQWYQGHYDDVQSLGQKYDVANTEGLGGIGIWEISQGTNRTELWDLIQTKFGCPVLTASLMIS